MPFLESFKAKYGRQSGEIVADSGYGNEQNYAYMEGEGIDAYVKYNMFHAKARRKHRDNAFLPRNMYYNEECDFYVCPMGQRLERTGTWATVSELGYRSVLSVYRAVNCTGCPLRGNCYKSKSDRRTIEVNHRARSRRARSQSQEILGNALRQDCGPESGFRICIGGLGSLMRQNDRYIIITPDTIKKDIGCNIKNCSRISFCITQKSRPQKFSFGSALFCCGTHSDKSAIYVFLSFKQVTPDGRRNNCSVLRADTLGAPGQAKATPGRPRPNPRSPDRDTGYGHFHACA